MPLRVRTTLLAACLLTVPACLLPAMAAAETTGGASTASRDTGGVSPSDPRYRPPKRGKIIGGVAFAPSGAPPEVQQMIAAANQIVRMPYRYGGGHQSFTDSGYDCSGSVSFALHGANLLTAPLDSSSFMSWGKRGKGRWATVYTNPGHAFLVVAGLRFDTGFRGRQPRGTYPGSGPRWLRRRSTKGFVARHPVGL